MTAAYPHPDEILRFVAKQFLLDAEDIRGDITRSQPIPSLRRIGILLSRELTTFSGADIGETFGVGRLYVYKETARARFNPVELKIAANLMDLWRSSSSHRVIPGRSTGGMANGTHNG